MDLHCPYNTFSHHRVSGIDNNDEDTGNTTRIFSQFVSQPLAGVFEASLGDAASQMSQTGHPVILDEERQGFDPRFNGVDLNIGRLSNQVTIADAAWMFDPNTVIPSAVDTTPAPDDHSYLFRDVVNVVQDWAPVDALHRPTNTSTASSITPFTSTLPIDPNTSGILGQALSRSTVMPMENVDPLALIGSVHQHDLSGRFVFKCNDPGCRHKVFGRWFDLRRHYEGTHAASGPAFWCQVDGRARNKMHGGRSFPRKDKLADHVRKVHQAAMRSEMDGN